MSLADVKPRKTLTFSRYLGSSINYEAFKVLSYKPDTQRPWDTGLWVKINGQAVPLQELREFMSEAEQFLGAVIVEVE